MSFPASLPAPKYSNTINFSDGYNGDIIRQMINNFPEARKEVKEFAKQFKGATLKQTCYNVWRYAVDHINYKADGSRQKIRMPARLIADGEGDCKSYSLLCAAILSYYAPVSFRFASYRRTKIPSHVYVIVGNGSNKIICDAVYHTFNSQKSFTHKKDIPLMTVETLAGIEGRIERKRLIANRLINHLIKRLKTTDPGSLTAIALHKRIAELRKAIKTNNTEVLNGIGRTKHLGKGKRNVKKVLLAPGRKAFLELVLVNFRGIARRLQNALKENPEGLKKIWADKLGGSFEKLQRAIAKGAKRKPLFGMKKQNVSGIGVVEIAAAAAAAAPVIKYVVDFIKTLKNDKGEEGEGSILDDAVKAGGDPDVNADDIADKGKGDDHSNFALKPIYILGGVAALIAIVALLK